MNHSHTTEHSGATKPSGSSVADRCSDHAWTDRGILPAQRASVAYRRLLALPALVGLPANAPLPRTWEPRFAWRRIRPLVLPRRTRCQSSGTTTMATAAPHDHAHHKHPPHEGHKPPSSTALKDPVCGMAVTAQSQYTALHEGHNYYFCSAKCQGRFVEAPQKYVPGADGPCRG